ncbi:thiolase domain-containing protein [Candidatus Poseidoniales archaeon]|nr:thiolase domain-containing protein [Candidatus Poseidoniales archaeon]|tara:strand:- start:4145 stop:5314 length:1170 start_codon:yes stop_codon:yes gene_type:complete
MVDVAMVGAGQTKFGNHPLGLKGMWSEAIEKAFSSVDNDCLPSMVDEAFIGSIAFGGSQLGNTAALLTEHSGMDGVSVRRVENACASSGFALRDAWMTIKSGQADIVVAGGIEKMNDLSAERKRYWLGVSGDTEWERLAGLTFPGTYALTARRYFHEFESTHDDLVHVSVKNHMHGFDNEVAHLRKDVSFEKASSGAMVADPLTLYDCCPTSDGASAVILVADHLAHQFTDTPVWIKGSGAGSDKLALHDRPSLTQLRATQLASQKAYSIANIQPNQIDLAEVHDCFTIAEVLATEDLGFTGRGEGGRFARDGQGRRNEGEVTINPSGGLKSKGHPLGATGTGQAVEVFKQLRHQVESPRQVRDAEVGLTHNVGGSGATCAVHIFGRER